MTQVSFIPDSSVRGAGPDFFPGSDWSAHQDLLDESGQMVANVGSFLIRTSTRIVLVDLGLGPAEGGQLLVNLDRAGVAPAEVDLVVLTHLHRDHIGWAGAFPRARYLADPREPDVLPVGRGTFDELPDDLVAVPAPGHTPGHTCLFVPDAGVLILGDLLHSRAQFREPSWHFRSDADPAQAARSRREVLDRFADAIPAGGHFSGDVFGASARQTACCSQGLPGGVG